ncbi:hypothetical protein ACNOYE_11780 [Nannocystaceae bacterium ST9]
MTAFDRLVNEAVEVVESREFYDHGMCKGVSTLRAKPLMRTALVLDSTGTSLLLQACALPRLVATSQADVGFLPEGKMKNGLVIGSTVAIDAIGSLIGLFGGAGGFGSALMGSPEALLAELANELKARAKTTLVDWELQSAFEDVCEDAALVEILPATCGLYDQVEGTVDLSRSLRLFRRAAEYDLLRAPALLMLESVSFAGDRDAATRLLAGLLHGESPSTVLLGLAELLPKGANSTVLSTPVNPLTPKSEEATNIAKILTSVMQHPGAGKKIPDSPICIDTLTKDTWAKELPAEGIECLHARLNQSAKSASDALGKNPAPPAFFTNETQLQQTEADLAWIEDRIAAVPEATLLANPSRATTLRSVRRHASDLRDATTRWRNLWRLVYRNLAWKEANPNGRPLIGNWPVVKDSDDIDVEACALQLGPTMLEFRRLLANGDATVQTIDDASLAAGIAAAPHCWAIYGRGLTFDSDGNPNDVEDKQVGEERVSTFLRVLNTLSSPKSRLSDEQRAFHSSATRLGQAAETYCAANSCTSDGSSTPGVPLPTGAMLTVSADAEPSAKLEDPGRKAREAALELTTVMLEAACSGLVVYDTNARCPKDESRILAALRDPAWLEFSRAAARRDRSEVARLFLERLPTIERLPASHVVAMAEAASQAHSGSDAELVHWAFLVLHHAEKAMSMMSKEIDEKAAKAAIETLKSQRAKGQPTDENNQSTRSAIKDVVKAVQDAEKSLKGAGVYPTADYTHAIQLILSLSTATDKAAFEKELSTTRVGFTTWRARQKPNSFVFGVSALVGIYGGGAVSWRAAPGEPKILAADARPDFQSPTLSLPIGFDMTWGGKPNKRGKHHAWSNGILLSVVDPVGFLSYDATNASASKFRLISVLAPGLFFRFGVAGTPLVLVLAAVYRPGIRDNPDLGASQPASSTIQFLAGLTIDTGIFASRPRRR